MLDPKANGAFADIPAQRFLLIKAFGAGFWCDMDHVVGGLLIAEMTGRIPVIYWGKNSIYGGSDELNAFEQFFQPVSAYSAGDLMRLQYSVFPEMWNVNNLISEEKQQYIQTLWHPLEVMLARNEEILVMGWAPLVFIQPRLPITHPALQAGPGGIYRYIFGKYIHLQPNVAREIDDFYNANMADRKILAVHVRGSDKITEFANIHQINKLYDTEIKKYLAQNPSSYLFLLTESEEILNEYQRLYKEKMIYTNCQRTGDDAPIYFKDETDKLRMGREVLKDVYLALRCDSFIGNGHSNVSNAVIRLRGWGHDQIKLFSVNDL